MEECWYALALALLANDYFDPERAFDVLSTGVIHKFKPINTDRQDMIEMKKTMTYDQIAEIYGIDRMAVWRIINNQTVAKPVNTDIADMIRLKQTMTYKQIGDIYGVTAQAIYNKIKKQGEVLL